MFCVIFITHTYENKNAEVIIAKYKGMYFLSWTPCSCSLFWYYGGQPDRNCFSSLNGKNKSITWWANFSGDKKFIWHVISKFLLYFSTAHCFSWNHQFNFWGVSTLFMVILNQIIIQLIWLIFTGLALFSSV